MSTRATIGSHESKRSSHKHSAKKPLQNGTSKKKSCTQTQNHVTSSSTSERLQFPQGNFDPLSYYLHDATHSITQYGWTYMNDHVNGTGPGDWQNEQMRALMEQQGARSGEARAQSYLDAFDAQVYAASRS